MAFSGGPGSWQAFSRLPPGRDGIELGGLVADDHHAPLHVQFTVQSATVEMSLTKMRLPEIAGAGQVALFATV
jgi:hypothetical protein